jgi:hypothetical protein
MVVVMGRQNKTVKKTSSWYLVKVGWQAAKVENHTHAPKISVHVKPEP